MFKRRPRRHCPRCRTRLAALGRLWVCARCLLVWHGDTFEPLTQDSLRVRSLDDYFFRF